jgi:hypothetical protein
MINYAQSHEEHKDWTALFHFFSFDPLPFLKPHYKNVQSKKPIVPCPSTMTILTTQPPKVPLENRTIPFQFSKKLESDFDFHKSRQNEIE